MAAGVRVMLDDFGAGALSLAQLRDFMLDKIKIDRSFIDKVCRDPKIVVLAHAISTCAGASTCPASPKGSNARSSSTN